MTLADVSKAAVNPAEIYEEKFVPALFAQWGLVVAGATGAGPGQRALDVACGTGALARAFAGRVGPAGGVVGVDPNPQMLEVARRTRPDIDWRDGRAEALPCADASFDVVGSQFGMMFFDDPVAGLREMRRVLAPGGRLVVAVCDAVERSPGYAAFAGLLGRLFGAAVEDAFRAPFALGDPGRLATLCARAGLAEAVVERREGTVRFESIDALVSTERACAWTLGGILDDAQFERLLAASRETLSPFADPGGRVAFAMPALLIRAGRD